ncbi:hypothetical protein GCM10011348_44890 [Marinobacterium nitratireducens]|uniref:Type II secretion system protein GspF domain-containing protein n=1 Tax=Marinobacterium nitratireducens TaxID=518897 RepID=A0A917ZS81_9GAMM|nr:type II secretion system F family protein [Marinobacterium nitratireducens]GGO88738.1 hypothetical protein GCM10011348_44890 [Marinobacterium nitratireducens]
MMMLAAGLALLAAILLWFAGRGEPPAKAARPGARQGRQGPELLYLVPRPLLVALVLLVVAGSGIGYRAAGVLAGAACAGLLSAAAVGLLALRRASIKRALLAELPGFVNQIVRRMTVGANLSQAVQQAALHVEDPLRQVLQRALQRAQLGDELADAFRHEARRIHLPELDLVATVFNINHQYGGSIVAALDNLVKLLQQRERAQRELRAMTGETRFTALVLGAMPLMMAGYLMLVSPDYLLRMWSDDGGRQLLLAGAGMQVAGVLTLWRMIRSI